MKIKLINPNTTQAMTDSILDAASRCKLPDTEVYAVSPKCGPDSIECFVDEYLAVPGVLKEIIDGDRKEGADAYVIACFGDPGLKAAREITHKPVIGIAEAAILTSGLLAPSFSILSVLDRSVRITEELVYSYGAERRCRSVRATGLSVLEFDRDPAAGMAALRREAEKAVREDGAECILLGCAGFVDFVAELREALGVPVLDGVVPAVKMAEALVGAGLTTSKVNTFKKPETKEIKGFTMFEEEDLKF
ncbi:MAG: aspartate/glutamate racemase family protein [Firmicutes bacterium]|nr:aspartate/glutamate racemase family protein [Bacillota bacterium]